MQKGGNKVTFSDCLRNLYISNKDYMYLSMNIDLKKCILIILISTIIGIIYNFVNPKGIPFISKQKDIKWASDSLVSSYKTVDALNKNAKGKPLAGEKYLLSKKPEESIPKLKSDSMKKKQNKLQTNSNTDTDEGFAEPIGINLEQAHKLYEMGTTFIDARDESEYKTGHIKNSINLSVYEFDKFKNVLSRIPKSQTIVCYCGGTDCDLSKQLANKLFSLGYRNNYIFIGGWEEWKTAGYKVE